MSEAPTSRSTFTEEGVAVLAAAAGLPIDPDRLPAVTVVLNELFALEAMLDQLGLSGFGPDLKEDGWPEEKR